MFNEGDPGRGVVCACELGIRTRRFGLVGEWVFDECGRVSSPGDGAPPCGKGEVEPG